MNYIQRGKRKRGIGIRLGIGMVAFFSYNFAFYVLQYRQELLSQRGMPKYKNAV
jgi:hypothetical protein